MTSSDAVCSEELVTPSDAVCFNNTVRNGDSPVDNTAIGGKLDGDYAYISESGLVADASTESGYAVST